MVKNPKFEFFWLWTEVLEGLRSQKNFSKLKNKSADNKFKTFFYKLGTNKLLEFEICSLLVLWRQLFWLVSQKNQVFQNFIDQQKFYWFISSKISPYFIFAKQMVELWMLFLSCFWGPQELLRPSKKVQILDSRA